MSWMKRVGREPLVHFLALGTVLFLAFGLTQERGGKAPNRILVDASQVAQLAAQFSRTWLRPPTQDELVGLIESHVRDEVYYREALAMGLDQNDPMIRRRMRQKLEFLLEDLTAEEPGDEELIAFLQQHPEKFQVEPRVSFRQLYLNPDRRRDLEGGAEMMLQRLRAGAPPESVGDPTLVPYELTLATQSEIARSFGEAFAQDVVDLAPGAWTGPIRSGLGAHLVLVTERREGRLPKLAEVRNRVAAEYMARRRQELKDTAYQKLREGYEVIIEPATTSKDAAGTALAATAPERPRR
jgi:hypothetical protein